MAADRIVAADHTRRRRPMIAGGSRFVAIAALVLKYVLMILLGIVMVTPFIWMISTSLKPPDQIAHIPPQWIPSRFVWKNYADAWTAVPFGLWPLFLVFAKIGSVLYGSGYVLLAFLRADLVQRFGWLTEQQLLDATAVGQVTPGPVFTTATFIGYVLGGPAGALVATFGIFLPAFVFVALSGPLVPRMRQSRTAAAVLDGVNVASLALMAVVSFHLARAALVDVATAILAVLSLAALLRFRINSAWLVAAGGLTGWLVTLAGGH